MGGKTGRPTNRSCNTNASQLLKSFITAIEKYIEDHNLSLKEFSTLVDIESSRVCQILQGQQNITVKTMTNILETLGFGVIFYKDRSE